MSFKAFKSAPISRIEKALVLFLAALGAMFELAGLAVFVPLLLLFLEDNSINNNKYLRALYDAIGIGNYGSFLLIVIAMVLFAIIVKNIILHKLNNYRNRVLLKLYSNYTRNLFLDYCTRGLSFIKSSNSTTLSHNVNVVCFQYVYGYINPAIIIAGDLFLSILIIASLGYINIYIAAIELMLFVPLILFFRLEISNRLQKAGRTDNQAKRNQWRITAEAFRGYADIVVNNYFPRLSEAFREGTAAVSKSKMQVERLQSIASRTVEISVILIITGVVAGYYFFAGRDSGFSVILGIFAAATLRLLPAVRSVISQQGTMRNNRYAADVIDESYGSACNMDPGPVPDFTFNHSIELKNISFDFGKDRPIFRNLSLSINRGERIGIRGASGSGKSTLLYLMMGLYKPKAGSVVIDGVELTPENRNGWHKLIGYVSQEVFVMDGTLARNISPSDMTDSKMLDYAIEASSLKELTEKLPDGVNTIIGENGSRLSGGEKQRIGIARAHYKGAEVLLMDEPTSSLDAKTENEITETLEKEFLHKDTTIIIISHSERLLSKCDRIIEFGQLEGVVAR